MVPATLDNDSYRSGLRYHTHVDMMLILSTINSNDTLTVNCQSLYQYLKRSNFIKLNSI